MAVTYTRTKLHFVRDGASITKLVLGVSGTDDVDGISDSLDGNQEITAVAAGSWVTHDGICYIAKVSHTAAADDEPGVGANWKDKWMLGGDGCDGVWALSSSYTGHGVTQAIVDSAVTSFRASNYSPGVTIDDEIASKITVRRAASHIGSADYAELPTT